MAESNEQSKSKKQRQSRATSALMRRAVRKILKQRVPNPDPKSKENWAEEVGANLVVIASHKPTGVGLQAIKIVMDQVEDRIPAAAGGEQFEPEISKAALRAKSEEELEAELKELRARLGSIVTASA